MKVNIGLCLVGVVIGEFIGAREGLGYLIIYGSQVFRLDWVMMSIVLLCMIAMLLYGLLGSLRSDVCAEDKRVFILRLPESFDIMMIQGLREHEMRSNPCIIDAGKERE